MSISANAKYRIIQETVRQNGNLLNIKWLCSVAGVSRSGYYHYLATDEVRQQHEEQDRRDFQLIANAFAAAARVPEGYTCGCCIWIRW